MSDAASGTTMSESREERAQQMDDALPVHVAVVMDGNGRWAEERGLQRIEGHYEGFKAAKRFVQAANNRGIKVVSLYAFSSENWSRPADEVAGLMTLMRQAVVDELADLTRNNVQLRVSGRIEELPEGLRLALEEGMQATKDNDGLVLNLCVNYGGRAEIVDAVREIARRASDGRLAPADIDESVVQSHLYNGDLPDPDLLIRPGGELRVSNFLLWEVAYAEFYVLDTYWPDFSEEHLDAAIADFRRRRRRFGGIDSDD